MRWLLALLLCLAALPTFAQDAVFEVDALNEGLPERRDTLDLSTPQSAMETFLFAVEDGDLDTAAQVLDLTDMPEERQATRGPVLAEKLAVVIDRKLVINWRSLLERPDALDANAASDDPMAGKARKSLLIGVLELGERGVAIRLNRLKPGREEPVWVFSRQTVNNVTALHDAYGPSRFERSLPGWARADAFWGMTWWEVLGLPLLFAVAWFAGETAWRLLGTGTRRWSATIAGRTLRGLRLPVTLAVVTFVVQFATTNLFVVSGVVSKVLQPLILLGYVAALLATVVNLIEVALDRIVERDFEKMSAADAEDKRALATTVGAVRRVVVVAVVLLAAGIVVTNSTTFQSMGVSLLASAGVLTLLLAFAARRVLGNILASMQIAFNRSARIGDQLVFQGELCQVEKINFSFVQLRHWTGTRMVVPVETFVSEMFWNRSLEEQAMQRTVELTLSPRADLDALREAFHDIVAGEDEIEPKEDAVVRVVSHDAVGMRVRFEVPCPDPATAWDIECRVREALIGAARRLEGERPVFPEVSSIDAA